MELVVTMAGNFIEHRDSGYYLVGSRVPIDRIVWEYRDGEQPEAIRSHYPFLISIKSMAQSPFTWAIRKKWKRSWRNDSALRKSLARHTQRLPS